MPTRLAASAARKPSNTSIGMPPGLDADLTRTGGTAPISTSFAVRFLPCLRHIARRLAAAGRMADVDGVVKLERRHQRRDVGRVRVHVMAVGGLGRTPMAAAVVRDHAIALLQEEEHLRVPIVAAERPAMMENDGLAGRPSGPNPCRRSPRRPWS